jgi:6,7-dimethyl-8-ribityllumazine synthase
MSFKIAIVASRYNEEFTDGLVGSARKALAGAHRVSVHRVPGAFEIPLAVQRVLKKKKPDAVLAFGLIWQGKTAHADLIAGEVTRALMQLGLEHDTPVLHGVLVVENEAQARARCLGKKLNRGVELANHAVAMLKEPI